MKGKAFYVHFINDGLGEWSFQRDKDSSGRAPIYCAALVGRDTLYFGGMEGQVYAIEFHPEMTREMVQRWATSESGAPKLELPGAQCHVEQMAGHDAHAASSDRWLARFLDELFLRPA